MPLLMLIQMASRSDMTLIPKNQTKAEKQQHIINRLTIEVERLNKANKELKADKTRLESKLAVTALQLEEITKLITQILN